MKLSHVVIGLFLLFVGSSPQLIFSAGIVTSTHVDLIYKAQSEGSVLVIVGVDAGFVPEAVLGTRSAVQEQRVAIASAQAQLRHDVPDALVYHQYVSVPAIAARVDASTLQELLRHKLVTSVVEDVAEQAALDSSGDVIGAPNVWLLGNEGQGQTIAILDTGVDTTHSFLGGRVVAEACFSNAGGLAGVTTLCPNGEPVQIGAGSADANNPACLEDARQLCNHGTHVAGIAAGGDGQLFNGVAPAANIVAIQVFTRFPPQGICGGKACLFTYSSDQIAALDHINVNLKDSFDIAAVNMSLSGGKYTDQTSCDDNNEARKAAIDNLRVNNIATIVAAGNSGWTDGLGAPSCISSAVGVGASTDHDNIAAFSNMHALVDLFAPGTLITSSYTEGNNTFATINGTSMAAPHVAGGWAVLKAMLPDATVAEIEALLASTTLQTIDDTRTDGTVVDKPRIDLLAAVQTVSAAIDWDVSPAIAVQNQAVDDIQQQTHTISNAAQDEAFLWSIAEGGTSTQQSARQTLTTLTHSAAQTITTGSYVCQETALHADNSFYRVFDLASDSSINAPLSVSAIEIGVESAVGGDQLLEVKLYKLDGALDVANLTLIGSATQVVTSEDANSVISIPVSGVISADGTLVVEILQPSGQHETDSRYLSLGYNNAGQTAPTYVRASACDITTITDLAQLDPTANLVLNVVGTVGDVACADPADIPWLTIAPTDGTIAPGGTQPLTFTYNTNGLTDETTYSGVVCVNGVDSDEPLITIPVTLNVGVPTAVSLADGTTQTGTRHAGLLVIGLLVVSGCAVVAVRKR